jgi:hypothetical protein
MQSLCFWTLSIVLFFYSKRNVSQTGFCLHLQVETSQLGPINTASPYLRTPAPTQDRTINQPQHNSILQQKAENYNYIHYRLSEKFVFYVGNIQRISLSSDSLCSESTLIL